MEKVEYNGKKYHTSCFTCLKCKKPIGENSFMPMDSNFMCMNCYNDNYASKCGGCSKVGQSPANQIALITSQSDRANTFTTRLVAMRALN